MYNDINCPSMHDCGQSVANDLHDTDAVVMVTINHEACNGIDLVRSERASFLVICREMDILLFDDIVCA